MENASFINGSIVQRILGDYYLNYSLEVVHKKQFTLHNGAWHLRGLIFREFYKCCHKNVARTDGQTIASYSTLFILTYATKEIDGLSCVKCRDHNELLKEDCFFRRSLGNFLRIWIYSESYLGSIMTSRATPLWFRSGRQYFWCPLSHSVRLGNKVKKCCEWNRGLFLTTDPNWNTFYTYILS